VIAAFLAAGALSTATCGDPHVWRGSFVTDAAWPGEGETQLTQDLETAIRREFHRCGYDEPVIVDTPPGVLFITFTEQAKRVESQGRFRVAFSVEYGAGPDRIYDRKSGRWFRGGVHRLARFKGDCAEDDLADCAAQIRSHAPHLKEWLSGV
jgi:hypothetical protein